MNNPVRTRVLSRLAKKSVSIGRAWEPSFSRSVPEQRVLKMFDAAVADAIKAEPEVLSAFGYDQSQRAELVDELLDVVIRESRAHATKARLSLAAAANAAADADRRAEEEERRRAKEAEIESVVWPLRGSPLVDESGAVRSSAVDLVTGGFAAGVAAVWPEHGGQSLSVELTEFIGFLAEALLHGADVSDGSWDWRLGDGSVRRATSFGALVARYATSIGQEVLLAAKGNFTYEQRRPWLRDELLAIAVEAVREVAERAEREAEEAEARAVAAASLAAWQRLHPAPPACPYGVSAEGAEAWCRDWLVHMGMLEAEATPLSGDGGVDIVSPRHVVQVKHYVGSVAIAELRELVGVAAVEGKKAVFMTAGTFPSQAELFADRAGMLLFRYDVVTATVEGVTDASRQVLQAGFIDG